jgi:DNA-binding MarR family transcriptional regulator
LRRAAPLTLQDYQRLAAFRLALRKFTALTEANARKVGLTPQQHQALLSIKGGCPDRQQVTISDLAAHLLLKNHSTVELVGRLVKAGLVVRAAAAEDRRRVCLFVTPKGEALLEQVSAESLLELSGSRDILNAILAVTQS